MWSDYYTWTRSSSKLMYCSLLAIHWDQCMLSGVLQTPHSHVCGAWGVVDRLLSSSFLALWFPSPSCLREMKRKNMSEEMERCRGDGVISMRDEKTWHVVHGAYKIGWRPKACASVMEEYLLADPPSWPTKSAGILNTYLCNLRCADKHLQPCALEAGMLVRKPVGSSLATVASTSLKFSGSEVYSPQHSARWLSSHVFSYHNTLSSCYPYVT